MRTWLFYKLGYWQDVAPFEWWFNLVSYIRYEWLWVDEDHRGDY